MVFFCLSLGARIKPYHFHVTADPQAPGEPPRYGVRGRRIRALIVLVLALAGLAVSVTGLAVQVLPRHFTAAQAEQIKAWEVAGRWRVLPAGRIFPASITYQLPPKVIQDPAPLNLDALRVGIAAQSGCAKGVTTGAVPVLRSSGCEAVLRATYVDATRSYVTTVGIAVFPTAAAAVTADQGLNRPRLAAAGNSADAAGTGRLAAGVLVVRYHGTAAVLYD